MRKRLLISRILFVFYLAFLVWIVIFKMNFSFQDIHSVREVNLIPFYYKDITPGDVPLLEALMNAVVFIPFGFLLTKSLPITRMTKKAVIIVTVSLIFEALQYFLSIGASDITDIITNLVGGIIGALLGEKIQERSSYKINWNGIH